MSGITNILLASAESPLAVFGVLFTDSGPFTWVTWLVVGAVLFFMVQDRWLGWRQTLFDMGQKRILLAIDIPKEHESSPQVVEQLFAQLWGSYASPDLIEKWWYGKFLYPYSVEIVSIDGYVQFLIHVNESFRDLVEASIYAQYPTADVVEVEDYVPNTPQKWPAEGWGMWATELKLVKPDVYPIRTYSSWEHQMSQKFADPLAAIIESMSNLSPGEQIWIQFVITPILDTWVSKSLEKVNELTGQKKSDSKKGMLGKVMSPVVSAGTVTSQILSSGLGGEFGGSSSGGAQGVDNEHLMLNLTPGDTDTIKAIQAKATKTAFRTKARFIYVARKEVFHVPRGVSGVMGGFRQYAELSLNAFMPNAKITTKVKYFFVKFRSDLRRTKIMKAYLSRHWSKGAGNGFILNTEELASVWHFPTHEVVTPKVKRAETRKASAPSELPTEDLFNQLASVRADIQPDSVVGASQGSFNGSPKKYQQIFDESVSSQVVGSQGDDTNVPPMNLPV